MDIGNERSLYIATSLSNAESHRKLAAALAPLGFVLTYDWTTHGSVMGKPRSVFRETAENEVDGVIDADLTIVLLPGGRGTHVELGVALAQGRRVIVHAANEEDLSAGGYECVFYSHPLVTIYLGTIDDLVAAITAEITGPDPRFYPYPGGKVRHGDIVYEIVAVTRSGVTARGIGQSGMGRVLGLGHRTWLARAGESEVVR